MKGRVRIGAVLLLVSAALSWASGAPAGLPCCAAPSETRMTAPACCGCDGSLARPVEADRAAIEPRGEPLAATPAAASSALGAPPNRDRAVASAALAPVRVDPASPFPRRL
jgi:hypothetical protein